MSVYHDVAEIDAVIPSANDAPGPTSFCLPERIKSGDRHSTLYKLLRSQKARGLSFEATVASCEVENSQRCEPPLPSAQLEFRRWWDQGDVLLDAADTHEKRVQSEAERERVKREARQRVSQEKQGPVPELLALTLGELAMHQFPARRPLLYRGDSVVFREGHLGQIYAERGFGKSWLMQTLALVAAFGIEALGFRNPSPCRVLSIDGEMASEELQERSANLCRILRVPAPSLFNAGSLTMIAADWQDTYLPRLDTPEGQEALEPFIEKADLVLLDNRSCLFDPEGEKDPTAWQPAQDYLLSLRRRGKAVLLAHHSNRQGGARGISKAEDPMNLLLKLTRPEDYSQEQGARFLVEFDKARGVYGAAAAPFIAALTPTGWSIEPVDGAEEDTAVKKLREYLVLADRVNERPKSASAAVSAARVNRNKGFEAWAVMVRTGEVVEHPEGGFHVVEKGGV